MTTPITSLAPSTASVRDDATIAWDKHAQFHGYRDTVITGWDTTTTPDGEPMLSGRVGGSEAIRQLRSFADMNMLVLGRPGDLRPVLDVSVPGRAGCVWRSGGVWVSLWADEPPPPPTGPVRAAAYGRRIHHFLNPDTRKD